MRRFAFDYLQQWKDSPVRMPLMVRGARQVGKSFLIEQFGKFEFEYVATVNLEQQKDLHSIFATLSPDQICLTVSATLNVPIRPGKTLLFLDEIQACPDAIQSLRYFYEKMPDLHIIAAGSLLEFVLADEQFSMPVGRIEYLFLYPMSFEEFLLAQGATQFLDYIRQINWSDTIPDAVHRRGLELIKQYCVVGGMPKAIDTYLQQDDLLFTQQIQDQLLNTYRDDFHKYGKRIDTRMCETIFNKTPKLIARHFKYTDIDPDKQSKQIKPALQAMIHAGIYHYVHAVNINGIPLNSQIIAKKQKILFIDVALVKRMSRIDASLLLADDINLIYDGQLAEQLVGQALLTNQLHTIKSELYYWKRDKTGAAEVDYVYQCEDKIIPMEVKSGHSGRLKSLQLFLNQGRQNKYLAKYGIKISQDTLGIYNNIRSIPFYLVGQLDRLCKN